MDMIRVYRIPLSTNVERIALAAGIKGITVEWVDVDPRDRRAVEQISGQTLVPVLETGSEVVSDSPAILRWLEQQYPSPALWPSSVRGRAEADLFVDWFNRAWKVPPNAIATELARDEPDQSRVEQLGEAIESATDLIEALLDGRDFLLGDLSVADVVAYPFLRYAVDRTPGDDELFHRVLREWITLAAHPQLASWIARMDRIPHA
jgi:glutathione S-transferase